MRKKEKRERRKKERAIVDFIMVMNHFFHYLREWLLEMDDPRNKSYITYTQADLFYMGLLKNVCGQYSMRGMDENFNEENCIDTLNYYLEAFPGMRFSFTKKDGDEFDSRKTI